MIPIPRHVISPEWQVEFTAVAEPRDEWREKAVNLLGIPPEKAFRSREELVQTPQLADGVLITMQDQMHAAPAIAFMKRGYHVLLEKPMATTELDCRAIVDAWRETRRILAVCHVMRYSEYSQAIKKLLDDGLIGEIACIQHIEPVGYWHIAHSFVRGNWRREDQTSPMLLAKSCHDLDILRYWVGRRCLRVSSFGSLGHFKKENKPVGAANRCLDCPPLIESGCPYSAVKIYLRDRRGLNAWPNNILSMDTSPEGIAEALRTGPYGRCVYACDNDVVDRQVMNMEFEGGTIVSFTMTGFTGAQGRETWIMGSLGQLRGRNGIIEHTDFRTDRTRNVGMDESGNPVLATGHAGDSVIIQNFVRAIAEDDPSLLLTDPEVSLESHLVAFAAERAGRKGTVEEIRP